MKYLFVFLLITFSYMIMLPGCKNTEVTPKDAFEMEHPRIMLLKGEEAAIKKSISESMVWNKMHNAIIEESDKIIPLPPIERIQIGRRLLDKSREALRRLFYLSYAYRTTGDGKYAERAEKEMVYIAQFSDWNPTHFLDVAEMTMAMAIGYDWMYDNLTEESRTVIREAILKKGLEPSMDSRYNSWLGATHNWNQVCNAGMVFGALAILEDYPEISKQIIDRAMETIHLPMEDYEPDGAYPEGYGYWNYGTSFNVLFNSAIDKAFPGRFDYSKHPGYLMTGDFLKFMVGPGGASYNWGDAGGGGDLSPAMFWFAQKNNDPSLLWVEKKYLERDDYSRFMNNRILPAIMIWGKDIRMEDVSEPESKVYIGQGKMPLMMAHTSWSDPNALYLGFKGGSPSVNHGHMDIGSFILEAEGVRWAIDLGSQSYESLESRGMSIFGRTQDAVRWTIYRLNNYSHNTLTVNNELQRVEGYAEIDKHGQNPEFTFGVTDMSSLYEGQLSQAVRGAAIVDQQYFVVRDELRSGDKNASVRWQMVTGAEVAITGKNTATLSKDGKQMTIRVDEPANVTLTTWSSQPATDYDAPNPGSIILGFETELPANASATLQVIMVPGNQASELTFAKPLADW
jgi:hypothetical protein